MFLKKLRVFFYIIQVQVAKSEKEHWHNTIASLAAFGPAISFITTTIKTQCLRYDPGSTQFRTHIACICLVSFIFNLGHFLSPSLFLLTLTFLKSTGQLFYKMALSLGLSDISSRLDSVCAFCQDYH